MEYRKIETSELEQLWEMQRCYKAEIGEDEPSEADKNR